MEVWSCELWHANKSTQWGRRSATHTIYVPHIDFLLFFFNFTFWAADDTGLLICCFWRGSSERWGRHFFWSPKIEVWGVCKCQSELNEPIKNSKATQSSWRRTLFWRPTKCCQSTFQEGFSAPVVTVYWVIIGLDIFFRPNTEWCLITTLTRGLGNTECLKITEKVWFKITSEVSYVYILNGQKFIKKCRKWSNVASFWKPAACGQTVLPDRSVLIGQNLVENVKIQMRHFE